MNNLAEAASLPSTVITFTTPTKSVFGDPDKTLDITQYVGLTSVTAITPEVCVLSSERKVKILAVGTCRLTATNPGVAGYKAARSVTRSFQIAKAPNVISIADFGWLSMANPEAEITTTESTGRTTLTSLTKTTCILQENKVFAIKLGKCTIRASNAGSANYLAAKTVSKTVIIAATSPIQPPVKFTGPWTIRLQNFNDSNSTSDATSANSWVASGWFKEGLSFRVAKVQALSTVRLNYLITDSKGRATPDKIVNLSVGKRYAGSNARVRVGNQSTAGVDKSPNDQLLVSTTTDKSGIAKFDITGLDPIARNGLYVQVAAWITDLSQDVI
ncbi:MAG: hypothetical protein ACKOFA_05570, partial [Rhodoluna sp.]